MKRKLTTVAALGMLLAVSCSKHDDDGYVPILATDSSHATLSTVLEYNPAPGQYVNVTSTGTTSAALALAYDSTFSQYVTLGAWGGSITFKFDHSVANGDGADLGIYGNAPSSYNWDEPGIVMVSQDVNNNGIADDTWYELAGSQYDSTSTILGYKVTYYNSGDGQDVTWKDNQGNTGSILFNEWGSANFYPLANANVDYSLYNDSISFEGTLLRLTFGTSSYGYTENDVHSLGWWGYSDSYSDGVDPQKIDNYATNGYNSFDISWARDSNGNTVSLQYIDFVKVYTGQLGSDALVGEISTEFKGARDLHVSRL
ncbi:MAG: hypothetical protein QM610_06380 [Chitinophagaceae bacterium]